MAIPCRLNRSAFTRDPLGGDSERDMIIPVGGSPGPPVHDSPGGSELGVGQLAGASYKAQMLRCEVLTPF